MKQYECLVPGCPWHTQAKDDAEIVRRASEHLKDAAKPWFDPKWSAASSSASTSFNRPTSR